MFRVFVEMCKVLFVGVYYCVGVLCFILFAMSIGTLVVPVLVKEVETGSVELFQSDPLPAAIQGESLQINSSPAATRLLPEISQCRQFACLLRSHPYLTLCSWISSTAGSSSMNSVCISTDRVGVTSSTEHLRASDVTSLKGYIGGALSLTHESLIQGYTALREPMVWALSNVDAAASLQFIQGFSISQDYQKFGQSWRIEVDSKAHTTYSPFRREIVSTMDSSGHVTSQAIGWDNNFILQAVTMDGSSLNGTAKLNNVCNFHFRFLRHAVGENWDVWLRRHMFNFTAKSLRSSMPRGNLPELSSRRESQRECMINFHLKELLLSLQ